MTAKLSLSWINAIVLVLLVAAWLGIWSAVERRLSDDDRLYEPREDETQLDHAIPSLQAGLTAARGELAAVEARLLERHLELAAADAVRRALRAAYPRLQALGVTAGGAGPGWLAVRPETLQGFVRARTELDATSRLVKALEADHAALIVLKADLERSEAGGHGGPRDASLDKSRLAACVERLDAARKKLAEARVELAGRMARVEALTASDPLLASVPADVSPLLDLPADAVATVSAAPARRLASEATSRELEAAARDQRAKVVTLTRNLISAQRHAAQDLEGRRERWDSRRRLDTLIRAFPISLGVLAVAVPALWWISWKTMGRASRILLGAMALGTLAIVDAYQAFRAAGGALAAVAVALPLGAWLVRRIGPPRAPAPAKGKEAAP